MTKSPERFWIARWIGEICELQGKYEEADRMYKSVIDHEPTDVTTLRRLGHLYFRQKDLAESERWYREAFAIDATDPRTLRELAYVLGEQEHWDEARQLAEQAWRRDDAFFSRAALAWILVSGDLDIARGEDLARRSLLLVPPDDPTDLWLKTNPCAPVPQHGLGLAYLTQGADRKALLFLEEAANLRPEDERIASDLQTVRSRLP
jgi:tetratricopeptide (TPR) repeat protein